MSQETLVVGDWVQHSNDIYEIKGVPSASHYDVKCIGRVVDGKFCDIDYGAITKDIVIGS